MKILDLTLPTPAENLAGDEALLDAAEAGELGEVLRFWTPNAYFVVVGYANKVVTETNVGACQTRGIPILRRCSGGGTVVQGPGCLNYTLVLRIAGDGPTHSISAANRFIMERNRAALIQLASDSRAETSDIQVCGHTDFALGGLKFSGNAQRRHRRFLLFHGTFLLDFDITMIEALLREPSKQPDYRNNRRHKDFLINLHIPAAKVKAALARAWGAKTELAELPTMRAETLAREKYSTREWSFKF